MAYLYRTATELVYRNDIKHMTYSRHDLLGRGWTKGLINEYLGPPDFRVRQGRYNTGPALYWKRVRVEEIEASLNHDAVAMIPRSTKKHDRHGREPMTHSGEKMNKKRAPSKKPTFEGYPYENYTVGISVAAREVIERVHRLANPQYPDLTAKEVVISAATNEYHNDGMPPWPKSQADFMCGEVLMVLLFDLTDQRLACWLKREEEDGKTPRVIIDDSSDPFCNDFSHTSEDRGNTIH